MDKEGVFVPVLIFAKDLTLWICVNNASDRHRQQPHSKHHKEKNLQYEHPDLSQEKK
jgi:hypothetical protein